MSTPTQDQSSDKIVSSFGINFVRGPKIHVGLNVDENLFEEEQFYHARHPNDMDEEPQSPSKPEPDTYESIKPSNMGYKMLAGMGWTPNTGLGAKRTGRVEPVFVRTHPELVGLGYLEHLDKTTANVDEFMRKTQSVEVEETEEMRKQREEKKERIQSIEAEVRQMNMTYYCEVCNKQYKNVRELNNHLSSYDHHHTKRLKELRQEQKKFAKPSEEPAKPSDEAKSVVPSTEPVIAQLVVSKEMSRFAKQAAKAAKAAPAAPVVTPSPAAPSKQLVQSEAGITPGKPIGLSLKLKKKPGSNVFGN